MYRHIPLPKSAWGEQMYEAGRHLVTHHGLDLGQIVWDADEVLWDWVMNVGRMVRSVSQLVRRDFSHREFFRVKPGVLELIWGMHHAAKETGADPWLRVWTDGYPWRMWQISQRIPGLTALLGSVDGAAADTHEAFCAHPRIFSRTDFSAAAAQAIAWHRLDPRLDRLPERVRRFVAERIEAQHIRATWKLPELAEWVGKTGFQRSQVLVDDKRHNVRAFAASGRRAVHLTNPTPHVLFGKVPNSVWSRPEARLERLASRSAEPLAAALAEAATAEPGTIVEVTCTEPAPPHPPIEFVIDVPDARIRAEWIDPVRRLRAQLRGRLPGHPSRDVGES